MVMIVHYLGHRMEEMWKPVRCFSIMSITSFTIATITVSMLIFLANPSNLYLKDNDQLSATIAVSGIIIANFGWRFGVFSLYLLVISRISTTFDQSMLKLSNITKTVLYSGLCVWLVIVLIELVLQALASFDGIHIFIGFEYDKQGRISFILMIIAEILHLILTTTLVYIFVSRIIDLFIMASYDRIHKKDQNDTHFDRIKK